MDGKKRRGRPPSGSTKKEAAKKHRQNYMDKNRRITVSENTASGINRIGVERQLTDKDVVALLLSTYDEVNSGHVLPSNKTRDPEIHNLPFLNSPLVPRIQRKTNSEEKPAPSNKQVVCRLCLDIYEKPTLLDCGHTFCLQCLQKNSRILQKQDAFDCPVCRETTSLPDGLVEKLPSNESIASNVADLRKNLDERLTDGHSKTCHTHDQPKEMFCINCTEFICDSCIGPYHRGHFMDARDIFEASIQQRVADLNDEWKRRKEALCTHHSQEIQELLNSVKEQIRGACREKAILLEENERALLEEVQFLHDKLLRQISTLSSRDPPEDRCGALELAMAITPDSLDGDTLTAHILLCEDLSHCLKNPFSVESSQCIKSATKHVNFEPADIGITDIGKIVTDKCGDYSSLWTLSTLPGCTHSEDETC